MATALFPPSACADSSGAWRTTRAVMWFALACFFVLGYPPTDLPMYGARGPLAFSLGLGPVFYTVVMFAVGIAMAICKASMFEFISDDYAHNIGAVSGVVGLAGGLAGFVLPIVFGALVDITGVRSTCFMLMFGVTAASLLCMHFSFRPEGVARAKPAPGASGRQIPDAAQRGAVLSR